MNRVIFVYLLLGIGPTLAQVGIQSALRPSTEHQRALENVERILKNR